MQLAPISDHILRLSLQIISSESVLKYPNSIILNLIFSSLNVRDQGTKYTKQRVKLYSLYLSLKCHLSKLLFFLYNHQNALK
jgi:hypothetical protein